MSLPGSSGATYGGVSADCPACGRSRHDTGRYIISCKRRDCPAYLPTWVGDHASRLKYNLGAWKGWAQMVTYTAPGADRLAWDTAKCGHPADGSLCEGPKGCVVNEAAAAWWNAHVLPAFSRAVKRTRVKMGRRRGGRDRLPVERITLLAYALELKRGVFHIHAVWGWPMGVKPSEIRAFLAALNRELVKEDFGRPKASKAAYGNATALGSYLAKYLAKDLAETLRAIPANRQPVFVSPKLTRETGVTMRFLRMKRRAWKLWGTRDYADLVLFFRWAESHGVDPFTWHRKSRRLRPPPKLGKWEPIAVPPSPSQTALPF